MWDIRFSLKTEKRVILYPIRSFVKTVTKCHFGIQFTKVTFCHRFHEGAKHFRGEGLHFGSSQHLLYQHVGSVQEQDPARQHAHYLHADSLVELRRDPKCIGLVFEAQQCCVYEHTLDTC